MLREKSSMLSQNLQIKQMYRDAKQYQKLKFTITGAPIWLNKSGKGSNFTHTGPATTAVRWTVCICGLYLTGKSLQSSHQVSPVEFSNAAFLKS